MLASFTVAFGITRGITWTIRTKGGIGPIKDVVVGDRHIHHFLPGGILALSAGGVAIGMKGDKLDKYLAFPFGVGVALVLDESALLLELDDVYWTEEGVLSVQIAFAAIAAARAAAIRARGRPLGRVQQRLHLLYPAAGDGQLSPGEQQPGAGPDEIIGQRR